MGTYNVFAPLVDSLLNVSDLFIYFYLIFVLWPEFLKKDEGWQQDASPHDCIWSDGAHFASVRH